MSDAGTRATWSRDDPQLGPAIAQSVVRRRKRVRRDQLIVLSGQILVPALILTLWEMAARLGWLRHADAFYSRPSAVLAFMLEDAPELARQALATMQAVLLGAVFGIVLGLSAGLLLGRLPRINRILDPTFSVLAGLPRIALAPLFLLWFGIGLAAKVFLSFSLVFFILLINVRGAVRTVDRELLIVARLMGAGPRQSFTKVVLPWIAPVLIESLRLSMMFSVLGVIASEMVTARDGLGIAIVRFSQTLQPAGVFAVLLLLAIIMGLISAGITAIEKKLLGWQAES